MSPVCTPARPVSPEVLLRQHWHLARATVRRQCRTATPAEQDDLEAVALAALWEAAQAFQPERGGAFVPFAIQSMRFAISHEARKPKAKSRGGGVRPLSLDEPLPGSDEGTITRGEALADPNAVAALRRVENADQARDLVECAAALIRAGELPQSAGHALAGLLRGETLDATAARTGRSREGVRKALVKAAAALRPLALA